MCTCIALAGKDHYFGRNLDLSYSYHETVTLTPENYPLVFRHAGTLKEHPAILGMAFVTDNYPLYYDAVNAYGLAMAGLNFPKLAVFHQPKAGSDNITVFEFIPWVLGQCHNLKEARELLKKINLLDEPYSDSLPVTPEHWMISDSLGSIVAECTKDGMHVYDNPYGVMTNAPEFSYMETYLRQFRHLDPNEKEASFSAGVSLDSYSLGMPGYGLPGDLSSPSRFVRAAYVRNNAVFDDCEESAVSAFFHVLGSVSQPKGAVRLGKDEYEITVYSSCMNLEKGIYYYTTYANPEIHAVDMHRENLQGHELKTWPLISQTEFRYQN